MTNLMYFSLFGGVMLLIYGIRQAGEGLQKATGPHLKNVLAHLTRNRVLGLLLGVVITALTQSSSATTAMLVGFVNSGLMQFGQTLGVILGADIGTTVTVQILAFNILGYSILLIGAGILMMYVGNRRIWKDIGQSILGFGFIFLSMKIMSDSMAPLKDSETFRLLLTLLAGNAVMSIIIAAVFTALVHSSAATIGVALSLAAQGLVTLPQAVPIIFGANIGTCATALIIGFSGSTDARRVAYAHTLFKILGVIIFLPFIGELAGLVEHTSPDPVRQIANAHTFFNVALAVIFLPFSGLMAKGLERAVVSESEEEVFRPKYLDEGVLQTPPLALSQTAREVIRMADVVQEMLSNTIRAFEERDEKLITVTEDTDDKVDVLDRNIRFYLAKINGLTDEQSRREIALIAVTSDLENIGDIVDKNLMALARKKLRNNYSFSKEGFAEIQAFHRKVMENFAMAVAAFTSNDLELAARVMRNKDRVNQLEREYWNAHIERLRQGYRESFETSAIHLDVLTNLERINTHITHIAFSLLESHGFPGHEG